MSYHEGRIPNREVTLVAELEGIKLFTDAQSAELTEAFDASTYHGQHASRYFDAVLEQRLSPLAAIGKSFGQYVGVDRKGLNDLIKRTGGIFTLDSTGNIDHLVRVVQLEEEAVYFPTETLLQNFFVQRRGQK